jgi:hypothetical protein
MDDMSFIEEIEDFSNSPEAIEAMLLDMAKEHDGE